MRAGIVMVTLAACAWGFWSVVLRPTGLPSLVTSPLIFVAMGACAVPFAWREPTPVWDRTTVLLLLGNTVCDSINVICFFAALRVTTVAIAVLTHYAAPILIALAAPRIDGVTAKGARPAAVVALVGLAIVLEPWGEAAHDALLGALLGLASAVGYAGNIFVVRRFATRVGNARALAYHSLLAALVLAPFGGSGLSAITGRALAFLAVGGAVLGTAAGLVYINGLRRIGSARAGVLAYVEALVAVGVGVVVWHEPFRPYAIVGAVLLVGAGAYVARQAE